jgi:hypothetical protein
MRGISDEIALKFVPFVTGTIIRRRGASNNAAKAAFGSEVFGE